MTRKKTTKKPATAKRGSYAAPKFSVVDEPSEMAQLVALMRRQNQLLEVIAGATARVMMIQHAENKLDGPSHHVPDVHGLRELVDRLLKRDAVNRELTIHNDGSGDAKENSGVQPASGDN